MQTSLHRPEIMQIHPFMKNTGASCLDLDSFTEMSRVMAIFRDWMKKKGYPAHASKWIRPYFVTLSDWTKGINSRAFGTRQEDITDCTILVATDAYSMDIDNPDVKLVIQWDNPKSFDSMNQRMRRAGSQSTFVFFSPARSQESTMTQRRLKSDWHRKGLLPAVRKL